MLFYYCKCKKNTKSKNLRLIKTNKGKLLSKCTVCDSKKNEIYRKSKKQTDC